ncbi:MAG: hypothetical protein ACR650_02205 [Methylocystis sp.]
MKKLLSAAFLAAICAAQTPALADDHNDDRDDGRKTSIAVFGDWPYSQMLLDNGKLLIDSINNDADVSLVLHVGDIHSGSMPCTSAGILPPISTSNPGWNQSVFSVFQQLRAPVVYTPGDNEWTDCHKSKEKSAGDPLKELASVRSLFFSKPGRTLGLTEKQVLTQAQNFDPNYPTDAQYVENVMWRQNAVVFVTVNMPGSNNDGLPWSTFENLSARSTESANRTGAAMRWLKAAFDAAAKSHARGVVIGLQADMWDPAQLVAGGDGLNGYTDFVKTLASLSISFGRPVLLINGDSHLYGSDQPLADPSSATGQIHHAPAVSNLTRITVQGSTNAPGEWLKLTIDPNSRNVFSWKNVPYCANPASSTSCQ